MGPRFEPPQRLGLSHFLEHMVMQGSQRFPTSNDIMRAVEDVGGIVDAGTHAEYVSFVFAVHCKHWARVMEIASDVLLRPLFDADEIEQEKLIIAQEISRDRDRQGRNIDAAELAYCMVFNDRRRFFRPDNMVVCLAGAFDFDQVIGGMRERFGTMAAGEGPAALPTALGITEGRRRAFYRATEALPVAEVHLSHNAYPVGEERFEAGRAIARLLGGGLSSRLFTRVREELGLVYDIASHMQGYSNAGTLDVGLSVSVGNLVPACEAVLGVLGQAAQEGFASEELERYKETARCSIDILCDQAGHVADWFGRQEVLLGHQNVLTPQQYVERQEALSEHDLLEAASEMLLERGACLAVVGPFEPEQADSLRALFPADEVTSAEGVLEQS
jgi:predicted Zn-dependent peptidase